VITGYSDSDYAQDELRWSISGYSTFLCGAPISMKSKTQETTTLSVTESELVAAASAAQEMHVVWDESFRIDWIEGTTPNGIGSRQQRCSGFG
jgi:hypothetical protein